MSQVAGNSTLPATLTGSLAGDVGTLFASGFAGPIFFWVPASTEVVAAAVGRRGLSPPLVGASCAAGQCCLYTLIFYSGKRLAARWSWLRRQVDAVAARQGQLLKRGSIGVTVTAAMVGFPPTVPLFTLASSFRMRLPPMLAICFAFRFVRFAVIAYLGGRWGTVVWPEWSSLLRYTLHPAPRVPANARLSHGLVAFAQPNTSDGDAAAALRGAVQSARRVAAIGADYSVGVAVARRARGPDGIPEAEPG